ncbi:cob(I)yrinic acid a,c-diamide adenosyltransferase [Pelosinus sp. sgz500959]|uniref:cob(I)yrinic acid a,c-diamide adenosyltransferase n=1 Tax=Pelosinus sp. sgz500959 TaxID=3242472 RepID=UPI00366B3A24
MADLGLIQVYTGNGKGKTTASMGLAFRSCGHGFKVCMIQFMKDNTEYGEFKASQYLPGFELIQVGRNDFVNLENPEEIDKKLATQGWELAKSIILSGEYDVVILDEINVAIACKLINVNTVVSFLTEDCKSLDKKPEIILTGRYAPKEIIDIAHLVTEMQEIRHNFSNGIESRQGIEF